MAALTCSYAFWVLLGVLVAGGCRATLVVVVLDEQQQELLADGAPDNRPGTPNPKPWNLDPRLSPRFESRSPKPQPLNPIRLPRTTPGSTGCICFTRHRAKTERISQSGPESEQVPLPSEEGTP